MSGGIFVGPESDLPTHNYVGPTTLDAADRALPLLDALAANRTEAARLDAHVRAIIHDRDTLRTVLRRLATADHPRHEAQRLAREAVRTSDQAEADRAYALRRR